VAAGVGCVRGLPVSAAWPELERTGKPPQSLRAAGELPYSPTASLKRRKPVGDHRLSGYQRRSSLRKSFGEHSARRGRPHFAEAPSLPTRGPTVPGRRVVRRLSTLIPADGSTSGSAGHDVGPPILTRWRALIGVQPAQFFSPGGTTCSPARRTCFLIARLRHLGAMPTPPDRRAARSVRPDRAALKPLSTYSGGMRAGVPANDLSATLQ